MMKYKILEIIKLICNSCITKTNKLNTNLKYKKVKILLNKILIIL